MPVIPSPPSGKSIDAPSSRALITVVVIAIALRLAFFPFHRFLPERVFTPDSAAYLELAVNLGEHGAFARSIETARVSVENPVPFEVFRTPGYPLLLALLGWATRAVVPAVICLQVLIDTAMVALVFGMARTLMPPSWALVAGLLAATDIGHLVYTNMVMADTLFAFLLTAALWLLLQSAEKGRLAWPLGVGLIFTLAAAVRPVGTLAFVPGMLFLVRKRVGVRRIGTFALAALAFPAAWVVRNGIGAGVWSVSDAFDYNLCLVAAAKVKAAAEGIPRRESERSLVEQAIRASPGADLARRSAAFRAAGWGVLRSFPATAVRETFASLAEFAFAGERRNLLRLIGHRDGEDTVASIGETARDIGPVAGTLAHRGGFQLALVFLQIGWNALLWLAAVAGCVGLVRRGRWAELLLFGSMAVYVAGASLVVANARMRMPLVGILAVMAALGGESLVGSWRAAQGSSLRSA